MRHIAAAFYNTPHAITVAKLEEIRLFLDRRLMHDWDDEDRPRKAAGPRDGVQMYGRVAVVPVMGVIAQRMNLMSDFSGGTSTEQLGASIDALAADAQVKAIVLNIDSPGGSVYGTPEIAEKIYSARSQKKIVAVANSVAASAAYWIGASASEFIVTPSGEVGSIGVVAAHTDISKAEEAAGMKTTVVTSTKSPHKAEFDPSTPLSDDARTELQASLDKYYAMFAKAVARGRGVSVGTVEKSYGQGRMLMAQDALAAGMVDRVATLEDTLRRLGGNDQAAGQRSRAAQMAEMGLPTA